MSPLCLDHDAAPMDERDHIHLSPDPLNLLLHAIDRRLSPIFAQILLARRDFRDG